MAFYRPSIKLLCHLSFVLGAGVLQLTEGQGEVAPGSGESISLQVDPHHLPVLADEGALQ